ncbi:MAG: hypothetical protein WCR67_00435 [Bacilli bacterium]
MTIDELKKSVEILKSEGWTEGEVLGSFYAMFQDGKVNLNEFEAMCAVIGYELTDEFKKMSPEDQRTKGYYENDEEETKTEVTEKED